ncbi:hypothetical protein ABZY16_21380 [Streptomyces sp. NPDC006553]|uniref:hypothetical protein n=1 Tax=unclassified Streptomyces TaxID=2593676 RepID=UPI00225B33B6|nr:hypothetical protein [Streptomyces sp. NBC_00233]MCX5230053.1 hypothetical protein [Streptomyces sp. NBC_00233]
MTPPPPQPPLPHGSTWWYKALVLLVPAVISGVVGTWAGGWFDDDREPSAGAPGQAIVEQPAAGTNGSGRTGAGNGSVSFSTDPDTHCGRVHAVGPVEWAPCARITDDAVRFGVLARTTGPRQDLRLRLGYVRAGVPARCDGAGAEASAPVDAGTTVWLTVPGCSVARVHGAVQTEVQVAAAGGSFSGVTHSPTLHVQPDGSVVTPAPS